MPLEFEQLSISQRETSSKPPSFETYAENAAFVINNWQDTYSRPYIIGDTYLTETDTYTPLALNALFLPQQPHPDKFISLFGKYDASKSTATFPINIPPEVFSKIIYDIIEPYVDYQNLNNQISGQPDIMKFYKEEALPYVMATLNQSRDNIFCHVYAPITVPQHKAIHMIFPYLQRNMDQLNGPNSRKQPVQKWM